MALKEVFPINLARHKIAAFTQNLRWLHVVFDAERSIRKGEKAIRRTGVNEAVVESFAESPTVLKVTGLEDKKKLFIKQGVSSNQEIEGLQREIDEARKNLTTAQWAGLIRAGNKRLKESIKRGSKSF